MDEPPLHGWTELKGVLRPACPPSEPFIVGLSVSLSISAVLYYGAAVQGFLGHALVGSRQ